MTDLLQASLQPDALITLMVLVLSIVLFVWGVIPPEVTGLLAAGLRPEPGLARVRIGKLGMLRGRQGGVGSVSHRRIRQKPESSLLRTER